MLTAVGNITRLFLQINCRIRQRKNYNNRPKRATLVICITLVDVECQPPCSIWPGCKQAGWWSPLREQRVVEQQLHFTHTLAWWCHSTLHLSHPWGCTIGQPTRQASALVRQSGMCLPAWEREHAYVTWTNKLTYLWTTQYNLTYTILCNHCSFTIV